MTVIKVGAAAEPACADTGCRIRSKISGIWGEADCPRGYRPIVYGSGIGGRCSRVILVFRAADLMRAEPER